MGSMITMAMEIVTPGMAPNIRPMMRPGMIQPQEPAEFAMRSNEARIAFMSNIGAALKNRSYHRIGHQRPETIHRDDRDRGRVQEKHHRPALAADQHCRG